MQFNVGAGLAAMGDAIAKTAGAMSLEAQRSSLQREALILADQLAGARESRGRAESHGYDLEKLGKVQEFTAGENKLNRENQIAVAGIGAGASMANARLSADTQKEINAATLAARALEHDKTLAATLQTAARIQIGDDGTAYSVNPATNTVEPFKVDGETLKFRDPDVAKAQVELIKTKTVQLNDLTRTYVPQIQALETTLRKLQSDPLVTADKALQKELSETQARLKALQGRFDAEKAPLIHELNEYARFFSVKGKVGKTPGPDGRAPLSDLIKLPGQQPSGMPGGLIDNQ